MTKEELNHEVELIARQIENLNRKLARSQGFLTAEDVDRVQRTAAILRSNAERMKALINAKQEQILHG